MITRPEPVATIIFDALNEGAPVTADASVRLEEPIVNLPVSVSVPLTVVAAPRLAPLVLFNVRLL